MQRLQTNAPFANNKTVRSVIVTGVSSGIGTSIARVLIGAGFRVFGSVRKPEDAAKAERDLGERFRPLIFDVTDSGSIERAADIVREAQNGSTLAGLVNNAGITVAGPLLEVPMEEFRRQIETNLIGPMQVIRAFASSLGTDPKLHGPRGRIVNLTSFCGKIGLPFLGPYVASKHALEGLSESLRLELMPYGIDAIVVGPGAVESAMWDKTTRQESQYQDGAYTTQGRLFREFMLSLKRLPPEEVGRVVLTALTAPHPKARYAVDAQPFKNWILPRMLPRRLLDYVLSREFELRHVDCDRRRAGDVMASAASRR
jgi:NAD(P)-dependent dehydrogenase (short-subunit alcohol dehydrogenase family)